MLFLSSFFLSDNEQFAFLHQAETAPKVRSVAETWCTRRSPISAAHRFVQPALFLAVVLAHGMPCLDFYHPGTTACVYCGVLWLWASERGLFSSEWTKDELLQSGGLGTC